MEAKVRKIKTIRQKNIRQRAHERDIAEICQCSVKMVQWVLEGKRGEKSELAQNILVADALLRERYEESKKTVSELFKRA